MLQIGRAASWALDFRFLSRKQPSIPRRTVALSKSSASQRSNMTIPTPPIGEKVDHIMEMFGDVRNDQYYWLRDDSRSNPKVLSHLQQENVYTNAVMADTRQLQEELYNELRGRIQEADMTVPLRKGTYFYYEKTLEGKQYKQHCRRLIVGGEGPGSVNEVMKTGPDEPAEEVVFDENVEAEKHEYYHIGAFKVSPNHKMIAYAEDTKGDEIYTVYVIDAQNGELIGSPLMGIAYSLEWADSETLVYITMDDIHRPFKVWRHHLGSDQSDDTCLYHEKDEEFYLELHESESKEYHFVVSGSKTTQFVLYLNLSDPRKELKYVTQRIEGVDTVVSHRGNHFFIKRRSEEIFNSELLVCPIDDLTATTMLLPHRPSIKLQELQVFKDYLVVYERENGLVKVTIYHLPPAGESIKSLSSGQTIQFIDPIYSVSPVESQFNSHILRYEYGSLHTPPSIYDYDMNIGKSVLKKVEPVLGGFDKEKYEILREWAVATDGTQVPISIVYRKDMVKLDGTDPLLLYGYGSYEICIEPDFRATRLSLIDRGFVYAIAHIRGGGEMGRKWYEDGKLLKKKNTFTDFIACAEYLLKNQFGSKEKICIDGRSAGGLLIGAVLNMRPDLFKAAVAGVPFVDVVTTMLDSSIPLTTAEWEEWGDPREEKFYFYMKSYSPVDNVQSQNYPNILVTAGLNDPRVLYSEPAKYVAKLREKKTDNNLLLFKCDFGAGHSSKSGRPIDIYIMEDERRRSAESHMEVQGSGDVHGGKRRRVTTPSMERAHGSTGRASPSSREVGGGLIPPRGPSMSGSRLREGGDIYSLEGQSTAAGSQQGHFGSGSQQGHSGSGSQQGHVGEDANQQPQGKTATFKKKVVYPAQLIRLKLLIYHGKQTCRNAPYEGVKDFMQNCREISWFCLYLLRVDKALK